MRSTHPAAASQAMVAKGGRRPKVSLWLQIGESVLRRGALFHVVPELFREQNGTLPDLSAICLRAAYIWPTSGRVKICSKLFETVHLDKNGRSEQIWGGLEQIFNHDVDSESLAVV